MVIRRDGGEEERDKMSQRGLKDEKGPSTPSLSMEGKR